MLGGPSSAASVQGCSRQRPLCHVKRASILAYWDHSAGKPSIHNAHTGHNKQESIDTNYEQSLLE